MGVCSLGSPPGTPEEGWPSDWPACLSLPVLGGASLRSLGLALIQVPDPPAKRRCLVWFLVPEQPTLASARGQDPLSYTPSSCLVLLWAPELQTQAMKSQRQKLPSARAGGLFQVKAPMLGLAATRDTCIHTHTHTHRRAHVRTVS